MCAAWQAEGRKAIRRTGNRIAGGAVFLKASIQAAEGKLLVGSGAGKLCTQRCSVSAVRPAACPGAVGSQFGGEALFEWYWLQRASEQLDRASLLLAEPWEGALRCPM